MRRLSTVSVALAAAALAAASIAACAVAAVATPAVPSPPSLPPPSPPSPLPPSSPLMQPMRSLVAVGGSEPSFCRIAASHRRAVAEPPLSRHVTRCLLVC